MKKILSVILVLSLCFGIASCSSNYKKNSIAPAGHKINIDYSALKQDGYKGFLERLDLFAAKLTHEVYSEDNTQSNVCISPVSVYMALAIAAECASGETRDEILNAVGVTYDEVNDFTKILYAYANRSFKYTDRLGSNKILAFEELANSLWADKDLALKKSAVDGIADNYNCDIFGVNFENGEGEKAIGNYIKDKTHGIIDGDINLSPKTLITIINTFYLKEVWNEFGDKLSFTDNAYDFKNADGSITNTKLLRGYYFNGNVCEGDGFTSFYTKTEHGFEIKFIVPTGDSTLEKVFTPENIYAINNIDDYGYIDEENKLLHHTRAFFPEYTASFDGDISKILKDEFDINKLFNIEECDFSSITDEDVACDGVIHKCSLEVNARGIEGAAVTVMPMAGAPGPLEGYEKVYHDYIIDRAFGFVITDNCGTVLFSGAVNNVQ